MLNFFKNYKLFAIVMLGISIILIAVIYQTLEPKKMLKIYQPAQVASELVDSTLHYVKKYHTIADFSLVNQNGDTITQDYYKDKIYIADFIFTTCPTICPIMTDHMVLLQEKLKDNAQVLLLSHTVTPE